MHVHARGCPAQWQLLAAGDCSCRWKRDTRHMHGPKGPCTCTAVAWSLHWYTDIQPTTKQLAYLPDRVCMLASFSCAGQHRCGLPAPDIIHSDGAVMHAHPQHVGVALREVKTGDTCSRSAPRAQVPSASNLLSACAQTTPIGVVADASSSWLSPVTLGKSDTFSSMPFVASSPAFVLKLQTG